MGKDKRWTGRDAAGQATGGESWGVSGRGRRDEAVAEGNVAEKGVAGRFSASGASKIATAPNTIAVTINISVCFISIFDT